MVGPNRERKLRLACDAKVIIGRGIYMSSGSVPNVEYEITYSSSKYLTVFIFNFALQTFNV